VKREPRASFGLFSMSYGKRTNISDHPFARTAELDSFILSTMFPSTLPQQPQQQQQQIPSSSQPPPSTPSNDGIFWSPAPTHPVQPTSILQRPPQQPLPSQQPPIGMNTPSSSSMVPVGTEFATGDYSQIFEWVSQLLKGPEGREKALLELSKKREQYDDLALILWHSFGISSCPHFFSLPGWG
jgi:hypothetical protein